MLHLKETLQKANSGFKGVGNLLSTPGEDKPWNILKETVSLPAATLSRSALNHNQSWMNKFAERFQFQFAPHGKTTMLPSLFKMQVASPSCWGMTLASAAQVAVAFKHGVKRALMANQLVGQCNMDIISTILEKDPTFEFICLVDSPTNLAQLGRFFQERGQKLKIFLEYGIDGGRTGIRNEAQEKAVLNELKNWGSSVSVVGVEFFEGVFQEEAEIRRFIDWGLSRVAKLASQNVFAHLDEVIITAAGTSWLDLVAADFVKYEKGCSFKLKKILRSGCYLIYDNGMYAKMEKRVLNMKLGKEEKNLEVLSESLKPALKIWAYVQSIPEPNLAIIGMGRRDVGNDCGDPVPYLQYRPGQDDAPKGVDKNKSWEIFRLMDQHSFMKIGEGDDIQIGDILAFNIYHACTTLDKWRNVLLIDDEYNVLDVYRSDF